ncbi:MAG: quinolinate synthase NadA [Spirochaetes bacterium]|nr:quinolinate synthase NadA [Spirochaetota bacterium]
MIDKKIDKKYLGMNKEELINHINRLKNKLGDKIVIPAHHYQAIEIVKFGDFIGDSYKLAVECSKSSAEFIVFCGVLFMAEGASILAKANQKVLLPEPTAGCPMADMADLQLVEEAYKLISKETKKEIVPVVYMNSYVDLKSFCGEKGGAVCTSSNAEKILDYFFKQDKAILFLPDYYLGRNTADSMNIEEKNIVKIKKDLDFETVGSLNEAKIFLWDGFCPIHLRFTSDDVKFLRQKYPDIKIIVHPESREEVVKNSDLSGSTEKINKLINESSSGSIWGVGTETTFVNRLAIENPDKIIMPLRESVCKNMTKITLPHLASSLESINEYIEGKNKLRFEISVDDKYKNKAKQALKKMIEIVEK